MKLCIFYHLQREWMNQYAWNWYTQYTYMTMYKYICMFMNIHIYMNIHAYIEYMNTNNDILYIYIISLSAK